MCAQRRNKQPEKPEAAVSTELDPVDLAKAEGAETQDATSEPGFALVLDDEVETEQSGGNAAPVEVQTQTDVVQDAVQTQPEDAQLFVQNGHEDAQLSVQMQDGDPVIEMNMEGITEILAVTSKSEHGFWRAGIRFSRVAAVLISVQEDGSGLCGDLKLSAHKVNVIRNEPHLKVKLMHPEIEE